MTKKESVELVSQYFDLTELVCPHVYKKFGGKSWQFLDTCLLETIYVLRTAIIKKPMYANNWTTKATIKYGERGLRCNLSKESKLKTESNSVYMSAHCNGCALDFIVEKMSAEEVRQLIIKNKHLLPYPIRIEDKVSWVHIDMFNDGSVDNKVTLFNA